MSEPPRPAGADGQAPSGPGFVALNRSPGFWASIGYAVVFGVVLAFAALAFLGLIKGGTNLWFTLPKNPGWFDGSLWWVAVTAGAGVPAGRRQSGRAARAAGRAARAGDDPARRRRHSDS